MQKITKAFFLKNFPKRGKNSYKNLNGKVLIVAGSADMPGAAVLCARAAYRAGAGFVALAVPACVYKAAVCAVPEALILKMPSEKCLKKIIEYNKTNPQDLILIGPGLGKGAAIMPKLLKQTKLPAVIDADALNFLAKHGPEKLLKNIPYILTPHEGEMKRLLHGKVSADKLSELTGAVSLLKGPDTIISLRGRSMQNTTGNEGLAKAGSGDILAGIIAGIWAQLIRLGKADAFTAAALGVYIHGAAADDAVKKISKTSLTASDVLQQLPLTLKKM